MLRFLNNVFNIGFSVSEEIMNDTFDAVAEAVPPKHKTTYDASFGKPHTVLETNGIGFNIGKWCTGKDIFSLMIVGGSGSNKSTSCLAPQLLNDHTGSYVVFDPAKELVKTCGPVMAEAGGVKVRVFDPDRPEVSEKFNGLHFCSSDAERLRLINGTVQNGLEGMAYDYWAQTAENLIDFSSSYVIKYAPPEHRTMLSVLQFLRLFMYDIEAMHKRMIHVDKAMLMRYKGFLSTPPNTLNSSLSTAINFLRLYDASNIATVTSSNTIDPISFRSTKQALFICGSASRSQAYRSIYASLFDTFFASMLDSEPNASQLTVTFLLDESANMYLQMLPQLLSLGRKHGARCATFWQDLGQISSLYKGKMADSIIANSQVQCFMPNCSLSLETCQMLEKVLGKYHTDESGQTHVRELLTVSEIRQLDKILMLYRGKKPMLVDNVPFYKQPRLRRKVSQARQRVLRTGLPDSSPLKALLYEAR